jgi:hypothetical protein
MCVHIEWNITIQFDCFADEDCRTPCKNPRLLVKSKGRGRDISLPKPPIFSGKFHTAHFI